MSSKKRQKKNRTCLNFFVSFFKTLFFVSIKMIVCGQNDVFKPAHAQKQVMKRASMEQSAAVRAERNHTLLEHFEKTMTYASSFLKMKFEKRCFVS